jgi:hypothetical protein
MISPAAPPSLANEDVVDGLHTHDGKPRVTDKEMIKFSSAVIASSPHWK